MKIELRNANGRERMTGRTVAGTIRRMFGRRAEIFGDDPSEGQRFTVIKPARGGGMDIIGAAVWYGVTS